MQNSQEQLPKLQLDLCYDWLQYGMDEDDLGDVQLVWRLVKEHLLKIDAEFLMIMLHSIKGEYLTQQQMSEIEHSTKEELVEILLPYFYHVPGKGMGKGMTGMGDHAVIDYSERPWKAMARTGKGKGKGSEEGDGTEESGDEPKQPHDSDFKIDGSEESAVVPKQPRDSDFKIDVKMPGDKTIALHVEALYDVDTVKALIKNKEGILKNTFGLIYDDKLMEDHKTLHYYKVVAGAELQLAFVHSGGGKRARVAGTGAVDKEQKLRELNGELLSKVMLLGTPMFRNPDTDGIILSMQVYETQMLTSKNVLKAIMQLMSVDTLTSVTENICGSTNNNDRFKKLSARFFEPACALIADRKAAFQKMEEVLWGLMEYTLTKTYMPAATIDWVALNKDVLRAMTNVAAGAMGEDDDVFNDALVYQMRGLAF